jgi:hypothetical protein
VRYALTWISTAPLLVIGLLAGHSLGYRLAVPDPHARAHFLDTSGHGYLAYAPLVVAVGLSLVLAAFVAHVRAAVRQERMAPPPWLFALLPPLAFLVQEYAERAIHSDVGLATALEPAVVTGLLLQLPIALIAMTVARALTRLAEVVGRTLAEPPRIRPVSFLLPCFTVDSLPRVQIAGRGWSPRGPPLPCF